MCLSFKSDAEALLIKMQTPLRCFQRKKQKLYSNLVKSAGPDYILGNILKH